MCIEKVEFVMSHHFISYSRSDAQDFAFMLYDLLKAGPPSIPVWLDQRDIRAGMEWDEKIVEAIRICESLIFIMTLDSVKPQSKCKNEWSHALKYKKPVIPILFHPDAEMPFWLGSRQYIDFTGDVGTGLAQLRNYFRWLASSEGALQILKDRLEDAERDLSRAPDEQQARIMDEMAQLGQQIADQQQIVENPQKAQKRVVESIKEGIERERKPERPVGGAQCMKFINHPPAVAPIYFQDRHVEMKLIGDFLKNDALRLMIIAGRAGMGKTAMVCRLLKSLEGGKLPDDGGPLSVDGIVYLSKIGTRRVNVPNLYADLCKLLPSDVANNLEEYYKNPKASTEAKMQVLLAAFPHGRVILLLDNFENLIDPVTRNINNSELDEALRAILNLPQHAVKVILTTRVAPYDLSIVQPGRQMRYDMDEGLKSPYAENILREMDVDGKIGLKNAPNELLDEARKYTLGNPRALEALFAILSVDRDTTLPEILSNARNLLSKKMVEFLVGEAFSLLDANVQRVMQALAVYARPVTPVSVDYLLQPYLPSVDSAPVLNRLVNMQFVRRETGRESGVARYHMHDVDSEYALSRVPEGKAADRKKKKLPPFTRFALRHRGANYFKETRKPRENWKEIEDLAPQLAEFELRCAGQDYDTAARVLLKIDSDYLLLWGHFRLVKELHERLAGKLSDPRLDIISTGNLGTAYYFVGEYQKAFRYYEKALTIAKEIGDRKSEGEQLGNLGNVYRVTDELEKSIEYYEKALTIAKEIGDRRNESIWLGNSGISYRRLKKLEKAIPHLKKALEITLKLKDKRNETRWLTEFGLVYRDRGEIKKAIEYYEKALKITQDIKDIRREGFLFGEFGFAYRYLGEIEKAKEYYEKALKIAKDIGDRSNENKWLGGLGKIYYDLVEKAIEYYVDALKISQEIGNRIFEGRWLNDLGEIFANEKQYKEAIACLLLAKDIRTRIKDKSLEKTESNLENLKRNLGEKEFEKLKVEVELGAENIVRKLPKRR